MADLPNTFWSGWIAVITIVSLLGLVWLVFTIYFPRGKADQEHQGPEPTWDDNLREGSNAPPLWWFWMIFSAMVFSVIYLMLFPGVGAFSGALNWSQGSRLAESFDDFRAEYQASRAAIVDAGLTELQDDTVLMETAEKLFSRNCAACHGVDGRGQASLFPNLMDIDWQWGGSPDQIEQTIRHGRSAMMPPWQASLGDDGVAQVAAYVKALSAGEAAEGHPGATQYGSFCVACHGPDGTGNPILGAPNLSDSTWLYGGSIEAITETLNNGRQGVMPAFGERLDDAQIKLLVAYLAR
ncbi:MAG: cytochrome-c oxidase, cbb3-type subunit III [Gammaproteobacteria bacterium]|nr:cytochrome-c oxidase, cbb3-type subunit III [Pseudomonadales bacterium]MCP5347915.1 cytochrome-c oxidase, cbb3-type subunit III [Pseudomonadales bacterium]